MKYLVKAKLIPEKKEKLLQQVANDTLGEGSVAFGEYARNMRLARVLDDGTLCWVEVCFCNEPLNEELPYWQEYFQDIIIENARDPEGCLDINGQERYACMECDCTQKLEAELSTWGEPFITKSR